MNGLAFRALAGACCMLLIAPATSLACNIPLRSIGPLSLTRSELRRPVLRATTRDAWKLDESWTSVVPQLNQTVLTKRHGAHVGVTFASQRALSIDALPPDIYGWTFVDDDDPRTPACAMVGKRQWGTPVIRVVESTREVRIAASSQRTPGDSRGCDFESIQDGLSCPNITVQVVKLGRPLGQRTLTFETFPE